MKDVDRVEEEDKERITWVMVRGAWIKKEEGEDGGRGGRRGRTMRMKRQMQKSIDMNWESCAW